MSSERLMTIESTEQHEVSDLNVPKKEKMITLISSDDVVFTIPRDAALLSDLITDIIHIIDQDGDSCNDNNIDDDDNDERRFNTEEETKMDEGYKLQRVNSITLQKVIEFMIYYHRNPMQPIPDVILSTFIDCIPQEYYRNFCSYENMDLPLLFAIREAADYLSIKPLISLTNVWLTFQVIGKSTSEIHQLLNIPTMTEDEMNQAQQNHPWALQPLQNPNH